MSQPTTTIYIGEVSDTTKAVFYTLNLRKPKKRIKFKKKKLTK